MRIHILGKDNLGWSIDQDYNNIAVASLAAGYHITKRPWTARIIHSLWWNNFIESPPLFCKFYTKILLTCSNFIDPESETFFLPAQWNIAQKLAPIWIAPSLAQKKILEKAGQVALHLPFFINFNLFSSIKNKIRKQDLLKKYNIPQELTKNKVLLASYQRDSLGNDLTSPKWQKNPDALIKIVEYLPKEKFLLLLAGPRRHYIIQRCKELGIPYYYIGEETPQDDVIKNMIPVHAMPELYALADIYLVTSTSEGGPKAILESSACGIPCLSTRVGLAPDYLDESVVFDNLNAYAKYLYDIVCGEAPWPYKQANYAYEQCYNTQTLDAQVRALKAVYTSII